MATTPNIPRTVIGQATPAFKPFDNSAQVPTEPAPAQAQPAAQEPEKKEDTVAVKGRKPTNFDYDQKYTSAPVEDFIADISLPSASRKDTTDSLRDTPNFKIDANPKLGRYLATVQSGMEMMPFADGLSGTVSREDAEFKQSIPSDIGELRGAAPRFAKKEGVTYTGESARNLMRSALKLGTVFSVPLWHSGFWVTLRSPTESELLELYRTINQDKAQLGRSTYGLLFSNTSVYTTRALMRFVASCIYETSLKLPDNDDILRYIKVPDISLLIWGLACSTWPNGFTYNRACIADIDKCQHVLTAKLNLTKLLATDAKRLTPRQVSHMTKRARGSMDVESINRYYEDFIFGKDKLYPLTEDVSVVLSMPSAAQHIDTGFKWISRIEDMYANAMSEDAENREEYLLQQARATSMRQYGHYVKKVIIQGEEITDPEDVEILLNEMSSSDEARDEFMKAGAKYLDESVISLIAIPTYDCPSCGMPQKTSEDGFANDELIPLDVAQAFFPLLIQKLQQIQER